MKLVLKTTTGKATPHDVEPTTTVAAIKDLLKAEYDVNSLRVCHKGKVLENDKTVQDLGFADGEVLFIAGKKLAHKSVSPVPSSVATPSPVASPVAPATPSVPTPTSNTAEVETTTTTAPTTTSPTAPTTTAVAEPAPVAPAPSSSGPEIDQTLVDGIKGMGFDDEAVIKLALRAAYMNPDRAVDFLLSGVSTGKLQELAEDAYPSAPPAGAAPRSQAPGATNTSAPRASTGLREALAAVPQFEQIRQVVMQNPTTLPMVMQQMQQHHPDAFALIQANPQEFNNILMGGADAEGDDDDLGALGGGGEGGPQRVELRPTPADVEPVERLVALGGGMWDRQAAMVVYLVCRRNEEVAANILFDNGGMPPQLAQALVNGGGAGGGGEDYGDADYEDEDDN